jgi:hypothetical protein
MLAAFGGFGEHAATIAPNAQTGGAKNVRSVDRIARWLRTRPGARVARARQGAGMLQWPADAFEAPAPGQALVSPAILLISSRTRQLSCAFS